MLDPARTRECSRRWWPDYQRLAGRRGVPPDGGGAAALGTRLTVAAAMLLHAGLADAAICGGTADWWRQIQYILPIIPRRPAASRVYALSALILPTGTLFLCDTHMVVDPTAEQITEMTLLAAEAVARVRHRAQGGAAVAFQLRRQRLRFRAQDAAARWR